jgi:hypothetical protein
MAKPKTMATRKLVSFPAPLAKAIEDFRYSNRIPSDSEAIRRLIEAGLSGQVAPKSPDAGDPTSASSSRPRDKSAERVRKKPAGPTRRQDLAGS